jgi:uncharacterized protein DUF429
LFYILGRMPSDLLMSQTVYVGIDVACAKKKRLPLVVCMHSVDRLETMPLRDWSTRPPLGEGNLMALETEVEERFAQDTVGYLREIEAHFSVKIQRIAIDAPSDARSADAERRQCELALGAAHISYFETPSWPEFEEINRQIEKHVRSGGRESHLPHANKLWMLVGFALFKILRRHWECLEVFPQAIVHAMGVAGAHKSSRKGYEDQLAAAARNTGVTTSQLASELNAACFGSRHDRLDAYLSAWVAALDSHEREAFGVPPDDAIWVPKRSTLRTE